MSTRQRHVPPHGSSHSGIGLTAGGARRTLAATVRSVVSQLRAEMAREQVPLSHFARFIPCVLLAVMAVLSSLPETTSEHSTTESERTAVGRLVAESMLWLIIAGGSLLLELRERSLARAETARRARALVEESATSPTAVALNMRSGRGTVGGGATSTAAAAPFGGAMHSPAGSSSMASSGGGAGAPAAGAKVGGGGAGTSDMAASALVPIGVATSAPAAVRVLRDGRWQYIPANLLVQGDVFEIAVGAQAPADAVLIDTRAVGDAGRKSSFAAEQRAGETGISEASAVGSHPSAPIVDFMLPPGTKSPARSRSSSGGTSSAAGADTGTSAEGGSSGAAAGSVPLSSTFPAFIRRGERVFPHKLPDRLAAAHDAAAKSFVVLPSGFSSEKSSVARIRYRVLTTNFADELGRALRSGSPTTGVSRALPLAQQVREGQRVIVRALAVLAGLGSIATVAWGLANGASAAEWARVLMPRILYQFLGVFVVSLPIVSPIFDAYGNARVLAVLAILTRRAGNALRGDVPSAAGTPLCRSPPRTPPRPGAPASAPASKHGPRPSRRTARTRRTRHRGGYFQRTLAVWADRCLQCFSPRRRAASVRMTASAALQREASIDDDVQQWPIGASRSLSNSQRCGAVLGSVLRAFAQLLRWILRCMPSRYRRGLGRETAPLAVGDSLADDVEAALLEDTEMHIGDAAALVQASETRRLMARLLRVGGLAGGGSGSARAVPRSGTYEHRQLYQALGAATVLAFLDREGVLAVPGRAPAAVLLPPGADTAASASRNKTPMSEDGPGGRDYAGAQKGRANGEGSRQDSGRSMDAIQDRSEGAQAPDATSLSSSVAKSRAPLPSSTTAVGGANTSSVTVFDVSATGDRDGPVTPVAFDDPEWRGRLSQLKPLGLNCLLNTHGRDAAGRRAVEDAINMLCAPLLATHARRPVREEIPLTSLAAAIGFSASATASRFTCERQVHVVAPNLVDTAAKRRGYNPTGEPDHIPSLARVMCSVVSPCGAPADVPRQMFTKGTVPQVLAYCTSYWDGTQLRPMIDTIKRAVMDQYASWEYAADDTCIGMSYAPVTAAAAATFRAARGIDSGAASAGLRSSSTTSSQASHSVAAAGGATGDETDASLPLCLVDDEVRTFDHELSAAEQSDGGGRCDDNARDGRGAQRAAMLRVVRRQVFIGVVRARVHARREMMGLIDSLHTGGIRFNLFSPYSEHETKQFGARIGIETDWNSCISLAPDDAVAARRSAAHAPLPRGIANMRRHIAHVDNVPLLVSLFSDCEPHSSAEMIEILQENGEVVVCAGSELRHQNMQAFSTASVAVAVAPVRPRMGATSSLASASAAAAEGSSSGAEVSVSANPTLSLSAALTALPCSVRLHAQGGGLSSLTETMWEGRRALRSVQQALLFVFYVHCVTFGTMGIAATAVLPTIFTGVQAMWVTLVIGPVLAVAILPSSSSEELQREIAPKNCDHRTTVRRAATLIGCRSIAVIIGTLIAFAATVARERRGSTSRAWAIAGTRVDSDVLREAQLTALTVLVALVAVQSYAFRDRFALRQRLVSGGRYWLLGVLTVCVLHTVFVWGSASNGGGMSSTDALPWAGIPLLALIALAIDWAIARHAQRRFRYAQRRARLLFATRLGQHSPIPMTPLVRTDDAGDDGMRDGADAGDGAGLSKGGQLSSI